MISIIMPTFNSSNCISRSIQSVLKQTYNDWELLITDDRSIDNTVEIIESFKDSRIRLFKLEKNSGAAVARNRSIANLSGDFIAFLDSDDEWTPTKLYDQISFMKNNNIRFSFTSYFRIESDASFKINKVGGKTNYKQLLGNTKIYTSSVMIRVFEGLPLMPNYRRRQDFAYWLDLLKIIDYAYPLNVPLTKYYVTPNSLSSNYIKSVKSTWFIYRNHEELNLLVSVTYLLSYLFFALKKRLNS